MDSRKEQRAGVYGRLSTDGDTVPNQLAKGRAHCDRRGFVVVGTFADEGKSGWDTDVFRGDFEELLTWIEAGRLDVVVTRHADRLYRNLDDYVRFEKLGARCGLIVSLYLGQDFDLSTPVGRKALLDLAGGARYESDVKSQRVREAVEARRAAGHWNGGPYPPPGCRYATDAQGRALSFERPAVVEGKKPRTVRVIEEDPAHRALCQEIADMLDAQVRPHSIANALNARGLLTRAGNRWKDASVRRLMSTPAVAGLVRTDDGDLVPGDWPAAITPEQWARVLPLVESTPREVVDDRSEKPQRPDRALLALGGGLTVCGGTYRDNGEACGKLLVKQEHRIQCQPVRTRGCGTVGIHYARLEGFVLGLVWEVLDSPRFEAALARERQEDAEQVALVEQLREIEEKLDRAYDAYVEGGATKTRYLAKKRELEQGARGVRRQLDDLSAHLTLSSVGDVATARRLWAERDVLWQRQFLSAVITQVTVLPFLEGTGLPHGIRSRKGESREAFEARNAQHWEKVLMARVSIDWRI